METDRIFKRKIYDRLLKWKETSNGRSALLVQGARRIGKSTIVEEFARREYDSYMNLIFSCQEEPRLSPLKLNHPLTKPMYQWMSSARSSLHA